MANPYADPVRAPVPPYKRVADDLRGQIERGELLPGEQLPSMARISETYGVSRGTARRVLVTLRDDGLIDIVPGWGSFVRER